MELLLKIGHLIVYTYMQHTTEGGRFPLLALCRKNPGHVHVSTMYLNLLHASSAKGATAYVYHNTKHNNNNLPEYKLPPVSW
jgi:hypothetical protein